MSEEGYSYKSYPMAQVQLEEGIYTLEELKELVAALEKLNQAAHDSLQPTKELL